MKLGARVTKCVQVFVLTLLAGPASIHAQLPLAGDYGIHDPSALIKEGDRYYTFGTGDGIRILSSTNLRGPWTASRIFALPPTWTTAAVPGFTGQFWAPDVAYFNGRYHVYYSVSQWETIDSAIGLVTTPSLQNPVWTDHGKVVQSDSAQQAGPDTDYTRYNGIDPSVLMNTDGSVWLIFGSYSDGIVVVQIDPATGKRLNNITTRIANNGPSYFTNTTEAPYVYKRGGYYYLFVNFGRCCSANSTYNIRVGRSTSITGPYLDKNGVSMVSGGGTVLLESTGRYIGPGHAGIFEENGQFWFSHHYYDGLQNGFPLLGIRALTWGGDGWPVVHGAWSAYYSFDFDGREQSGQYTAALVNGAAVITDVSRGKVLGLAGSQQHLTLPHSVGKARTFSTWVKWDGGPIWQRIFDFGASTSAYMYLTPSAASGRMRFAIADGGSEQGLEAPAALPQNQWCHVAVMLDGSRGVLYLDGSPVASGSITIRPWELLAGNLYLGRSQFSADPYFTGSIDDFRIHSRALAGGEVAQLAGTKVGGTRAVAYWNFEEGIADAYVSYAPSTAGAYDGSVRDVSGNGNHLSAWDATWALYRSAVPSATTPATAVANTRSVQNANSFPSLSAIGTSLTDWSPTEWTIEAAIRPDGIGSFQTIVGRDSFGANAATPAAAALYFSVRPGGVLAITFTDAAGNIWNLESATNAISAGKWQAVAATSNGRTLRLYRRNLTDGEPSYTQLGTLNISSSANPALSLGAGDGANWDRGVITVGRGLFNGEHTDRFLGYIDDIRLSDAALTPSEFLYRASATVAHWNFEEGTVDTYVPYAPAAPGNYDGSVRDVSGNNNHLSAWSGNRHWYRAMVASATTPQTGAANTVSVENANSFPGLSAIGTSLTDWNPSEWTIEAAIRPDGASAFETIVGRDSFGAYAGNPAAAAMYFSVRPNGILAIQFTDAAGNFWNLESAANAIVANQWQAVAAVSDGDTLRLYRRNLTPGAAAYSLLGTLDLSASTNPALSTGAGDGSDWDPGVVTVGRGLFNGSHTDRFLGYIDDVRLSSAALAPGRLLYSFALVPPSGLTATAGRQQVALSWNSVAGASSYNVRRATVAGGPYTTFRIGLTTTTFVDSAVTPGTAYYYVVSTVIGDDESANSPQVSATPLTPAQAWRQTYFGTILATGDAADDADPDSDSVTNFLERALGGHPKIADPDLLPTIDLTGPVLSIIYRRALDATDLTFTVIETTDLSLPWTSSNGNTAVLSDDGTIQRIRFTRPAKSDPKLFLRLKVAGSSQ